MDTAPPLKLKKRMYAMLIIFCVLFLLLILRLMWLQIIMAPQYSAMALEQQTRDNPITPARGSILDRNGTALAVSVSSEVVSVTPSQIKNDVAKGRSSLDEIADKLAECLSLNRDDVYSRITKDIAFQYIKRKIDKAEADAVRAFITEKKLTGIQINQDIKRYYPYGQFLSQVLGFVGIDNQGLEGIEAIMDNELKGTSGRVITAKSAKGIEMPFEYEQMVEPEDGATVVLTIDETIQHFVENHLETAYTENRLREGAAAIVMDVKTGEILSMATVPNYDPNSYLSVPDNLASIFGLNNLSDEDKKTKASATLSKLRRNKAVVDSYEPGSVFKVFTAAMGLEENVVKAEDRFYCGGSINVADRNIRCWKAGGHGSQNFLEGIEHSCNPVFITVGQRVGLSKFFTYFKGFGLTSKTGIELSGETSGIFHKQSNFKEIDLATSSFGQSFQVTPLQMIVGISAIANNGQMMKPHLIKGLQDKDGNAIKTNQPEVVRQVVSASTSAFLRNALEKVVSEGTGSNAYVSGFRIAGKTGTSEKTPRGSGKYIASFCGFAPADDPQVAVIVMLDEPSAGAYYGGVIAAPVVGKILGDTLSYLNIEPQYSEFELETMAATVPDVKGSSVDGAVRTLTASKFKYKIIGSGTEVISQFPLGGSKVNLSSTITLYTTGESSKRTAKVPDVSKMTVTQATQAMAAAGLNIKITGAGSTQSARGSSICFSQSIAPGQEVEIGTVITCDFRTLDVQE